MNTQENNWKMGKYQDGLKDTDMRIRKELSYSKDLRNVVKLKELFYHRREMKNQINKLWDNVWSNKWKSDQ